MTAASAGSIWSYPSRCSILCATRKVLSFPNVDYEKPSDFTGIEDRIEDYFDPENGELCLGDIVISMILERIPAIARIPP